MNFEKVENNIFRLCVPFENIYTSVFAVENDGRWLLFDCGTDASDVNEIIIPAIKASGFVPDVVFVSHSHGDHAGGLEALKIQYPGAEVKRFCDDSAYDGEVVFGCLKLLNLKGHSDDSGAVFDIRTKTLISGDSLQLCGVGRYGTGVQFPHSYLKTIERLLEMDIDRIIASHDYYPLGFTATGIGVKEYILKCKECFLDIVKFVKQNQKCDVNEIAGLFDSTDLNRPPVPVWVLKIIKNIY